jgi:UDP-N-acetylglucosamine--N-acetylmuramyl-(pentapeptide) pyrophosphoryl-undecaprenol N-acetylglucosamine transferase
MGLAWGAADLALSRAGANSVAEAWVNTVPTVFLPYPYHRDRHQEHNAQRMVRVGGALIETDHVEPNRNASAGGTTLRALMRDHSRREAMRANLRSNPTPDAARTIARMLLA